MSDTSKHCREITRRLKGTEQRAMSAMQTMMLGHEGRLESMRGWIEEIGTTRTSCALEVNVEQLDVNMCVNRIYGQGIT